MVITVHITSYHMYIVDELSFLAILVFVYCLFRQVLATGSRFSVEELCQRIGMCILVCERVCMCMCSVYVRVHVYVCLCCSGTIQKKIG